MPACASSAAVKPFSAALPGWKRLVMAPSARKAQMPPVKVPAMPSASAKRAGVELQQMRAAAAAAPKLPQVPVECQPRSLCAR